MLISLLMLSLITIIAVAFLGTMNWELSASRRNYDNQKAQALAMLGMKTAVAQLRHGLDTWDNPYANFATNPPTFYWSMSPGLITRWSYSSTTPLTNYPLFSIGTTNLVNLNAVMGDGTYPIAGITNTTVAGATAPNISVYWVNVLKNPANTTASSVNPLIGRYAFWVDDENAKINVNTADGTMKYQTNSLGLGSPSEVSLQALQQGGANLATNVATNIVYLARTTGLNSPKEILRAAGTTPDLYTNNEFNLTAYSRSPDLNVFGQPKMVLTPLLGDNNKFIFDMTVNSITLQPSREIYPTPSQLPKYGYIIPEKVLTGNLWTWHPATPNTVVTSQSYPLALRGMMGPQNSGVQQPLDPNDSYQVDDETNYPWINGMMLAKYLSGTNAAGTHVTWPALPGSSSTGFAGKYTPRQLDSIVAQILSLGAKDTSPDIPFGTANQDVYAASFRGLYSYNSPFLFDGWLSNEWVSGMGRAPKVSGIELEFLTRGAQAAPTDPINYHPAFNLDVWMEWWMPSNYLGGRNDITVANSTGGNVGLICFGHQYDIRVLNSVDLAQDTQTNTYWGAALPRADNVSTNYWGNQMLGNNQGIDFQNNWASTNGITTADPDQAMAAQYHDPFALETNGVTYAGVGQHLGNSIPWDTPFAMTHPQTSSTGLSSWKDWQPGEMVCTRSYDGPGIINPMPMSTNGNSNPTVNFTGGIQVRATLNNYAPSDPDPVPLEAIRGTGNPPTTVPGVQGAIGQAGIMTAEYWGDPATPFYPASTMSIRTRITNEVIPVNPVAGVGAPLTVSIPAPNTDPSGITKYVFIKVADPLVNKFPGDWTPAGGATASVTDAPPPNAPSYWLNAGQTDATVATNNEFNSSSGIGGSFRSNLKDPDSYWLPQADVPLCYRSDLASETIIPRSARFPSIGYLQYVRTGIMPDIPTPLTPGLEHGTPFRLLNFSPSTDPSQWETNSVGPAAYPDWAMLDLVYIPSTLEPYGGPYGYYQTNSVWQGYGNPSVLANNSTGGGSTPGRINPNGVVIYTTNVSIPQPGLARTVPLQAMMYGLMVNQSLSSTATGLNPTYTGGTAVDDSISESDANSIPVAIENYIRTNGPLQMPGQLCNVPVIAALRASVNPTQTRNDLIRQIIGNVTTQSDTFSVWVAGQSLAKSLGNTGGLSATDPNWGLYQAGDQVLSSVRYHFIVERYLDPGADGVYGNSTNAGVDGVNGTYDDPVDPINHPFQPRYLYRVVSAEEIR